LSILLWLDCLGYDFLMAVSQRNNTHMVETGICVMIGVSFFQLSSVCNSVSAGIVLDLRIWDDSDLLSLLGI
jgi:N-acetyl-anhydromuramyl-L-alanine amidase AmpD